MGRIPEEAVSERQGKPVFRTVDRILFRIEAGRFSHNSNIRKFRIEVKQDALIRHAAENRRIM